MHRVRLCVQTAVYVSLQSRGDYGRLLRCGKMEEYLLLEAP
jgi:hypothetical protein